MKKSNDPLVTIVIPTLNRAHYLRESLSSAINQTYENIIIIVSDNASTDNTEEVVKELMTDKVKYVKREKTLKLEDHYRICIDEINSKYFLPLPDDDVIEANAVEEMMKGFECDDAVVISTSNYFLIDENSKQISQPSNYPLGVVDPEIELPEVIKRNPVGYAGSASIFSTHFYKEHATIVQGFIYGGDIWIIIFALLYHKIYLSEKVLRKYRIHSLSSKENIAGMLKSTIALYENLINFDDLVKYKSLIEKFYLDSIFGLYLDAMIVNDYKTMEIGIKYLEQIKYKNHEIFEIDNILQILGLRNDIVENTEEFIVYGTGVWGRRITYLLEETGKLVCEYVESTPQKDKKRFKDKEIISPSEIKLGAKKIIIASTYQNEITSILENLGYISRKDFFQIKILINE